MTTEDVLKSLPRPVIVVGNGTPPRDLGAEIDAHASVIRINNFVTEGFEKLVGTKTTIRCVNGWTDIVRRVGHTEITPFRDDAPESANLAAYRERGAVASAELDVHPLLAELGIKQPSTGVSLVALFELLEIPVTVCGFDGFRTPHYWAKERGPTVHSPLGPDAIARMHCTTIIGDEREAARQLMLRASSVSADRSKKRPYEVEKYLYQFQHQQGSGGGTDHSAYVDGWERTFGKKAQEKSE